MHTDSLEIAKIKAPAVWQDQIEMWKARLRGDADEAQVRYEAARDLAQRRGFNFKPVGDVVASPDADLVARIDAAHNAGRAKKVDATALLGTVAKPQRAVSSALDAFWPLSRDALIGKSTDQIRRWQNPRKKAFNNFMQAVGDLDLSEITRDHMLQFRDWLIDRVESGTYTANSANKDLTHFAGVIRLIDDRQRLGLDLPLSGLKLKSEEAQQRPAFSRSWIEDKILAPGRLDGLNTQARCLLLGMINTGYRPSEGAILGPDQIHLDGNVPYISIEPVGRTLKTRHARRVIPLLGVSLEAFRQCSDGFPRYANSGNVTAMLNKFLTENDLRETPRHSSYSLRHAFQERMVVNKVDDRIRREVFGHALTEDRYGEIPVETIAQALEPVVI